MPDWVSYIRSRLTLTGLRREREVEIIEDLARQLDEAYRDAKASGASDDQARLRAEQHVTDWAALGRDLSGIARGRLTTADRWEARLDDHGASARRSWFAALQQDLLYAWRVMRQSPGITAIAMLSLALGIGANTAIFSVVNGLILRPLPVSHPETLVSLTDPASDGMATGIEDGERTILSYHEYEGLRDRNDALAGMLAFGSDLVSAPVTIQANTEAGAERADVTLVSGTYFPLLGVVPQKGQVFGADVDRARMATPVVVVSDRFWRLRLGGAPDVVGRSLRIRQTPFTIVGVLPAAFTGLVIGSAPELFVPLTMQQAVAPGADWLTQRPGIATRRMFLHVLGRLAPGMTVAQANVALNRTFKQNLEEELATIADKARAGGLLQGFLQLRAADHGMSPMRGEYRDPLVVLMSLVALLLLLACANVANLLLARAAGRRRELALRAALGAERARLIRQLLTESLVLAAIAAAAGLWLSRLGVYGLLRLVSDGTTPIPLDVHIDTNVLLFTVAVTIATGVLFGLAPALGSTRLDISQVLRGSATNIAGSGRGTGRWPVVKILGAAQVALSLLLLVTAGLFVRTLQNLASVPLGYESDHLVMFGINPATSGYTADTVQPLYESMLASIRTMPGVQHASIAKSGLFFGSDSGDEVSFPDDTLPAGTDMGGRFDIVGADYFATVGQPVQAGRDVTDLDATGPRACWIDETMRTRFFGTRDPVGHTMVVHRSMADETCTIQGVVGAARTNRLRGELPPRYYLTYFGSVTKPTAAVVMIRVAGSAAIAETQIRQLLRQTNRAFGTPTFRTVADLVDERLQTDRMTARLSTFLGLLALVLAAIGLYGLLSYSVSRRVSEMGVRLALGATRGGILRLVVGEALVITAVGAAAGLVAAIAATRAIESRLFNLSPRDPITLAGGCAVLLAVAIASAVLPAWRASRTDPIIALRQ